MQPTTNAKTAKKSFSANRRISIWYGALILVVLIFTARLFYLQIIKHDYYRQQALNDQLKEYEITPERGVIKVHDGNNTVPIVLNETLYTLYADPTFAKNKAQEHAVRLADITRDDQKQYEELMQETNTRYVVLAKRVTRAQKEKIEALKLPGIGLQAQNYRNYPQGSLAAQLLGFVNNEGEGTYGIEQNLDGELAGTPGRLKAITDAAGVPLAASRDNIQIDPTPGKDVVLTIDLAMQKQLEDLLKKGLNRARSTMGSALIMDPNTGAIKAMANWPTYKPGEYYKVSDAKVFNNSAVSDPIEVGSIMKVLTASAGLDMGAIKPGTSYYDPARWKFDGHEITNVEESGGAGKRNIADVLNLSINTGATWILMQMGGKTGEITDTARSKWHNYMVDHYRLGKKTGIEQGYEGTGYIPDPKKGFGLSLAYANTSFGQAMTATPLQMAAALSSVVNGGTYYKPRLVDQVINANGNVLTKKPEVVGTNVVSQDVSKQMISFMEYVVEEHNLQPPFNSKLYSVGGKTGTAQIANPAGGYYKDRYNGTYLGFVGGDKPEYVIAVRVKEPRIGGYAGSGAAQPIFSDLAHMLIDNFNVTPRSKP